MAERITGKYRSLKLSTSVFETFLNGVIGQLKSEDANSPLLDYFQERLENNTGTRSIDLLKDKQLNMGLSMSDVLDFRETLKNLGRSITQNQAPTEMEVNWDPKRKYLWLAILSYILTIIDGSPESSEGLNQGNLWGLNGMEEDLVRYQYLKIEFENQKEQDDLEMKTNLLNQLINLCNQIPEEAGLDCHGWYLERAMIWIEMGKYEPAKLDLKIALKGCSEPEREQIHDLLGSLP